MLISLITGSSVTTNMPTDVQDYINNARSKCDIVLELAEMVFQVSVMVPQLAVIFQVPAVLQQVAVGL